MIKNAKELNRKLVERAKQYGLGCKKVFVAASGGVDSSLVAVILCEAFGAENVIGMYRDVKSNPIHKEHVKALAEKFGFLLINIDANPLYDMVVDLARNEFQRLDLPWAEEGSLSADELGFTSAFSSLKSRLNTPLAGFFSKAIDNGRGRIFGTGNGEEDELLRYFDKYGDGAVDNNLLVGLNKAEVRQLALWKGVPEEIVLKIPSADLEGNGNKHNDENQLTAWARELGYDIDISYGSSDGKKEGNVAWAWKQDIKYGLIRGFNRGMSDTEMIDEFGYSDKEVKAILFLRDINRMTNHKVEPIPGVCRNELLEEGLVD